MYIDDLLTLANELMQKARNAEIDGDISTALTYYNKAITAYLNVQKFFKKKRFSKIYKQIELRIRDCEQSICASVFFKYVESL